jgi:hypothetical protein
LDIGGVAMNCLRHSYLAVALGCLALAASLPAAAQETPSTRHGFQPPTKQHTQPGDIPQAPPPALPGAVSTATPAEKTATDLPPTEALFDSINRGDIASARDALSRGADLGGQNVLGMTPLELSVDLSRNDITFLLLSLRSPDATPLGPAPQTAATAAPAGSKKLAGKSAAKPAAVAAAKPIRPAVPPQAAPATPREYAGPNASGTPNPQAGFLGFGGTVQ